MASPYLGSGWRDSPLGRGSGRHLRVRDLPLAWNHQSVSLYPTSIQPTSLDDIPSTLPPSNDYSLIFNTDRIHPLVFLILIFQIMDLSKDAGPTVLNKTQHLFI